MRAEKIIGHSRMMGAGAFGEMGDRYDAQGFVRYGPEIRQPPSRAFISLSSAVSPSARLSRAFIYFHAVRMPHVASTFGLGMNGEAEQGEKNVGGEGLSR